MKKTIRNLCLAIMLCVCIFAFAGCSNPFAFLFDAEGSAPPAVVEPGGNTTVLPEDNEGNANETDALTAAEIAESYLDITFTVCITEVIETTTTTNGESSTTTEENLSSYGSGFIARAGGYIVTNHHCIESVLNDPVEKTTTNTLTKVVTTTKTYYKAYVSQDNGKTMYPVTILWQNSTIDAAIVMCEEDFIKEMPAAKLKDRTIFCDESEKIQLLEEVVTIGNQKAYNNSATFGYISSTELRLAASGNNIYEHLIQHHAPINHGNSGGALVDMDGNVIGLNTLGDDTANSLFFAVSIYPVIAVLDKVVENYEFYGLPTTELTLGISARDSIMDEVSSDPVGLEKDGMYVLETTPACIVEGLVKGDVIVGVKMITAEGEKEFEIWDSHSLFYARINLLYAQSASFIVERTVDGTTTEIELELSI